MSSDSLVRDPRDLDGVRARRLAEVVGAVAAQALLDWGADRVALLDDATPEFALALEWLRDRLGQQGVIAVTADRQALESLLQLSGGSENSGEVEAELRRMTARLDPKSLIASAANKTTLLLNGPIPPDPLLPLGDLYASEVAQLAGECSVPRRVRALADRCGGIDRLDAALRRYIDDRDPEGLSSLGSENKQEVLAALDSGRASRLWSRIVPKIGRRTLGLDLFE